MSSTAFSFPHVAVCRLHPSSINVQTIFKKTFVKKQAWCVCAGCPYPCVGRAPDIFNFASNTACARAVTQSEYSQTTHGGGSSPLFDKPIFAILCILSNYHNLCAFSW